MNVWIYDIIPLSHVIAQWESLTAEHVFKSGIPTLQWLFAQSPSIQFSPVTQSCLTLCNPMDCSTPGLPVHHHLLESTQTHVHPVGGAIQSSHPLSSPSPPALNRPQHQGLFK